MFRGFRTRRALTQAAFAEAAGVPVEHVEAWEERKKLLTPATLRDLATVFNVSVSDLLHKSPKDVDLGRGVTQAWMGPKPVLWGADAKARMGMPPFAHYGYLRLQLTAGEGPRWFPISAEQACWLQSELDRRSGSEMVIGKTLNNRVLIFPRNHVRDAKVLTTEQAVAEPDFMIGWDKTGLPPELYRLLRNWVRKEHSEFFNSSPALNQQREAVLDRPGMRRRITIGAFVDDTYVYRISDASIALSAEPANLQTAVRSLRLGMLTAYFAERDGTREWLVPVEDIRLIDAPALDLEEFRQFDVILLPD